MLPSEAGYSSQFQCTGTANADNREKYGDVVSDAVRALAVPAGFSAK